MPRLNLLLCRADYLQFANHHLLKYHQGGKYKLVCRGMLIHAGQQAVRRRSIDETANYVVAAKEAILIFSTVGMNHQSLLKALPRARRTSFDCFPHRNEAVSISSGIKDKFIVFSVFNCISRQIVSYWLESLRANKHLTPREKQLLSRTLG